MSGREKKGKAAAKGKGKPAAVEEEEVASKGKKGGKGKKGQDEEDITEEELIAIRMARLALKNKKPAAAEDANGEGEDAAEAAPAAESAPAEEAAPAAESAEGAEETEEAAPKKGGANGAMKGKKGAKGGKGAEEADEEEAKPSPAKGKKGAKGGKGAEEEEEAAVAKPAPPAKGGKKGAKAEEEETEPAAPAKGGKKGGKGKRGEEEEEDEAAAEAKPAPKKAEAAEETEPVTPAKGGKKGGKAEETEPAAKGKGKKGAKAEAEEEETEPVAKGKKGGKAAKAEEEEAPAKGKKGGKKGAKGEEAEEAAESPAKGKKGGKAAAKPAAAEEAEENAEEEAGDAEAEAEATEEGEGEGGEEEGEGGEEEEEEEGDESGAKGGKSKKQDARRRKAEAEAKKREEAARKKAQRRVDKATAPLAPQEISVAASAGVGANGEARDHPWYVELKGKNKLKNRDIVCDNFGVTLGGQVLLKEGTKLSLIYGHKYGMVGRNGLGKSVMLRKISSRDPDLSIPEYIRILHVEQEVVGDDKTPLQSVLEADQEREWLLREAARMLAVKNKNAPAASAAPAAAPAAATGAATPAPAAPAAPDAQGTPAPAAAAPAPAATPAPAAAAAEAEDEEEEEKSYTLSDIYERLRDIDSDRAEARAATILAGLGFGTAELRTKKTREYSGGWRMRIALARALFCQPDLLLLDEPNNHLDLEACIWLENYLVDWKKTLLVVSHDSAFLNEFVDHVIHIHQKTLTTYKGDYDTFVKVRETNRRSKQKKHDAQEKKQEALKMFVQKNQNKQGKSRARQLDNMAVVELDTDDPTMKFSFPESGGLGPLPLKFKDVAFKYGERTIFAHLNFGIDCDSRIALVGRNGVGKSTLMSLMVGQLEASSGYIERDRHMRVARFTQHHVDQLDLTVTVMNYFKERFPAAKDQEIRQHVAKFGITNNLPNQKIETLSGGQKSRVAFAELAWKRPHILFLDEPSNHLDVEAIESLAAALAAFDGGVVLISHNQYLVQLVCSEIWVVGNQTVTRLEGSFADYKKLVAKEIGLTYV